jgi:hypothetical protein
MADTTSAVSLEEQLRCAKRELAMRQRCYPEWVRRETMTEQTARRELAAMSAIVETLAALLARETAQQAGQGELFASTTPP